MRRPGKLLITAIATLEDEGPTGSLVQVQLGLFANKRIVDNPRISVRGGETAQVPLQGLAPAHTGTNSVGFQTSANYAYNYEGRNGLRIRPVSIIVTALPAN